MDIFERIQASYGTLCSPRYRPLRHSSCINFNPAYHRSPTEEQDLQEAELQRELKRAHSVDEERVSYLRRELIKAAGLSEERSFCEQQGETSSIDTVTE